MDSVIKLAVEPKFEILEKQMKNMQMQIKDIQKLLIEIKKNQEYLQNNLLQIINTSASVCASNNNNVYTNKLASQ